MMSMMIMQMGCSALSFYSGEGCHRLTRQPVLEKTQALGAIMVVMLPAAVMGRSL